MILAAGNGYRMGMPKVFCTYLDKSFLRWISDALPCFYLKPIVVIQENYIEDLQKEYPLINKWIINDKPETGMFNSFLMGLQNCKSTHICIIPIDFPYIQERTYNLLYEATIQNPNQIIKPIYKGKGGHPVIMPVSIKAMIKPDQNRLDHLISECGLEISRIEVSDSAVVKNINYPEEISK